MSKCASGKMPLGGTKHLRHNITWIVWHVDIFEPYTVHLPKLMNIIYVFLYSMVVLVVIILWYLKWMFILHTCLGSLISDTWSIVLFYIKGAWVYVALFFQSPEKPGLLFLLHYLYICAGKCSSWCCTYSFTPNWGISQNWYCFLCNFSSSR